MKKIKRPNITAIFICCCYVCLFFVVVPLRTNDVCFFSPRTALKEFLLLLYQHSSRTKFKNDSMEYSRTMSSVAKETCLQRSLLPWQLPCLSPNPVKPTLVIVVGPPTPLQRKSPTVPCSMYCSCLPLDWFVFISLELWLKKKWTYCLNI